MLRKESFDNSSSLGGNVVQLTISKVISLCITMLTTMLLSRFRTYTEYGTYSQLLLVVNLCSSLFMLGLPGSVNYFLARAETQAERRKFLSVYYTLSTVLSAIMGMVLVLAVPLIEGYFKNPLIRGFSYFLAFYPWTTIISSSIENVLIVYQRTRFLVGYRLVNSLFLLGTVLVIQWLNLDFSAYLILYVVVCAAFSIVVYFIADRLSGGLRFSLDCSLIQSIFFFSLPLGLASVVGTLSIELDKLLIGWLMTTEDMAIYTNASKELPVTIVASSITAVLLPQLARMIKAGEERAAVKLWGVSVELSLIFIALVVSGVFTYAEDVISLLYSAKYLPGISVFRVYTLVLLLRCTYFGIILNAKGSSRQIFTCSVVTLVINAIMNPLFYWVLGITGPAVATLLSILFGQIWQLRLTAQAVGITFREIFPWWKLLRIIIINIIFAICFGMLKELLPIEQMIGNIGEALLLGIVWTLLYAMVMRKSAVKAWSILNTVKY